MNWIDIFWLVMPNANVGGVSFGIILVDVCCTIGVGGIYVAGLLKFAGQTSVMPVKDPRLEESLKFHNI